jgi:hypothetical protein
VICISALFLFMKQIRIKFGILVFVHHQLQIVSKLTYPCFSDTGKTIGSLKVLMEFTENKANRRSDQWAIFLVLWPLLHSGICRSGMEARRKAHKSMDVNCRPTDQASWWTESTFNCSWNYFINFLLNSNWLDDPLPWLHNSCCSCQDTAQAFAVIWKLKGVSWIADE